MFFKKLLLLVVQYVMVVLVLWVIDIATPYISGLYIDYLVTGMELNIFAAFVVLIAAASLIQMLFRYLQSIVSTKLSHKMAYQMSNDIFQKVL